MRGTPEDAGLIPLAVHEIFALIESCQDREFLLRVSYMEVGWKMKQEMLSFLCVPASMVFCPLLCVWLGSAGTICIRVRCMYSILSREISNIRPCTVYIYGSGQP